MKKRYGNWMRLVFMASLVLVLQISAMAAEPLPADWQQLDFEHFTKLYAERYEANNLSATDSALIRDHAWNQFVNNDSLVIDSTKAWQKWQYLRMARRMAPSLSPEQKLALKTTLQRRFVNDQTMMASLAGGNWHKLDRAMDASGASPALRAYSASKWVDVSDKWKNNNPGEMAYLIQVLDIADTAEAISSKEQVVSYAWKHQLNNTAIVLKPKERGGYIDLAKRSLPYLTIPQKEILTSNLITQLINNVGTEYPLTAKDWAHLDGTLVKLNISAAQRSQVAANWLAANSQWQQMKSAEMGQLVTALAGDGQTIHEATAANVVAEVLETYLTPGNIASGDIGNLQDLLLCSYFTLLSCDDKQKTSVVNSLITGVVNDNDTISSLSIEQFRLLYLSLGRGDATLPQKIDSAKVWMQANAGWQNASLELLAQITRDLHENDSADKQKLYSNITSALAGRSDELASWNDEFNWTFMILGYALADQANQNLLRAYLEKPDGAVQMSVAKMLAWANWNGSYIDDSWKGVLEAKLADPQLTGDKRVGWLIARAYADSIHAHSMLDTFWMGGKQWLEEGFVIAETDAMRLQCAEFLLEGYVASHHFDMATSALDSIAGQFESQVANDRLAKWREIIRERNEEVEQYKTEQAQLADDAWRVEIQRRLNKAIEKGDTRRIRRFQSILEQNP